MDKPLISLSVPVYGTESVLPALLDSVLAQQPLPGISGGQPRLSPIRLKIRLFGHSGAAGTVAGMLPIEVIIVNDGSPGGAALPSILKPYKKRFKALGVPLTLLEHRKNLGLFEARRTAALAAKGQWICCVDPDDTLPPDAFVHFYKGLLASGKGVLADAADIIHGKMSLVVPQLNMADTAQAEKFKVFSQAVQSVHEGFLSGEEVLESFLLKKEHSSFLCAKLFRTGLLQEVYAGLPHTFCIMAEDLLLYFFVLLKQPSYYGIGSFVYNYINDTGISSATQVTNLNRWEKICSTASVFTLIFSYIQEHPLDQKYVDELRIACNNQLKKSISKMNHDFTGSLRGEAYAILCDYWGGDYVKQVEADMEQH